MFEKFYKGFDKDLKCRGFQYEVGKTYEEPEAVLCKKGFHAYENPLDTFRYYPPGENRYCLVELDGVVKNDSPDSDTKVVGKKIRVDAEIGLEGIIREAVKYAVDTRKQTTTGCCGHAVTTGFRNHAVTTGIESHAVTTGDYAHAVTDGVYSHAVTDGVYSHAVTAGDYAHAVTTGDGAHAVSTGYGAYAATTSNYAHAVSTGDKAHATTAGTGANAATFGNEANAEVKGKNSIAIALGVSSCVCGELRCWLSAADGYFDDDGNWQIRGIISAEVDGERIKPGVWYTAKDGVFVEADV